MGMNPEFLREAARRAIQASREFANNVRSTYGSETELNKALVEPATGDVLSTGTQQFTKSGKLTDTFKKKLDDALLMRRMQARRDLGGEYGDVIAGRHSSDRVRSTEEGDEVYKRIQQFANENKVGTVLKSWKGRFPDLDTELEAYVAAHPLATSSEVPRHQGVMDFSNFDLATTLADAGPLPARVMYKDAKKRVAQTRAPYPWEREHDAYLTELMSRLGNRFGTDEWYHIGPLERMAQETGADDFMHNFLATIGPTSRNTDVDTNVRSTSWANYLAKNFPDEVRELGSSLKLPAAHYIGSGASGAVGLPDVLGNIGSRGMVYVPPSGKAYKAHTYTQQLGGNPLAHSEGLVADKHYARVMARDPKAEVESPNGFDYFRPEQRGLRIADELEIPASDFQARLWFGLQPTTGVNATSRYGVYNRTLSEMIAEMVRQNADMYGIPIEEMKKAYTRGELPLLKGGGLVKGYAAGGLATLLKHLTGRGMLEAGRTNVVKPKGGQWLSPDVENSLAAAKGRTMLGETDPEVLARLRQHFNDPSLGVQGEALGRWVDTALAKYIKQRMASPDDEIRMLADQGIRHINPRELAPYETQLLSEQRAQKGFPAPGVAATPEGRAWEAVADANIGAAPADRVMMDPRTVKRNPWLASTPPDTMVYMDGGEGLTDLGFDELIKVLQDRVASGQLRPEQLNKVSVGDAVRLANDKRVAAEAEALKKALGLPMVREYKENNPLGLSWREIAADDPDAFEASIAHLKGDEWNRAVEQFRKDRAAKLQGHLTFEGDTMGHCVGNYCDDVLGGDKRIFSLRDAKGMPHVTIEVGPRDWSYDEVTKAEELAGRPLDPKEVGDVLGLPGVSILQVKGSGKKDMYQALRPGKDDYLLPFIQDFIRQPPEGITGWQDVRDLHNTGLRKVGAKYLTPEEHNAILDRRLPDGRPVMDQDTDDAMKAMQKLIDDADDNRFAEGGLVEYIDELVRRAAQ